VLAVATDVGVDLLTSADQAASLKELLRAAGAAEVSEQAAEIIRVESGRPRFGLDMGPESMPAEAGITERAVVSRRAAIARSRWRGCTTGASRTDPAGTAPEFPASTAIRSAR
jgi:hypothetical protein